MANSLMLHGVTRVVLTPIKHHTTDSGKHYARRNIRIEMDDGRALEITVFSDHGDDPDAAAEAVGVVEVQD